MIFRYDPFLLLKLFLISILNVLIIFLPRQGISVTWHMLMISRNASLLLKLAFLIHLLAFGPIWEHDDFKTDSAEFDRVSNSQMKASFGWWNVRRMLLRELDNLPCFVSGLYLLLLVVLDQQLVIHPVVTYESVIWWDAAYLDFQKQQPSYSQWLNWP